MDIKKLSKASEGCPEATSELYVTYSGLVYSEVIKIVKNHEDAQDILQRTFELGFRKVNTLKNLRIFPYWLKTIGRNQAINYYKKKKLRENVNVSEESKEQETATHPLETLKAKEFESHFKDAVRSLPKDFREIFCQAVLNKRPYKEIAETHKISLSLVKLRVYRSRILIQKFLKPYLKGDQS